MTSWEIFGGSLYTQPHPAILLAIFGSQQDLRRRMMTAEPALPLHHMFQVRLENVDIYDLRIPDRTDADSPRATDRGLVHSEGAPATSPRVDQSVLEANLRRKNAAIAVAEFS